MNVKGIFFLGIGALIGGLMWLLPVGLPVALGVLGVGIVLRRGPLAGVLRKAGAGYLGILGAVWLKNKFFGGSA